MACKYIYKGITYNSKEEFISQVVNPQILKKPDVILPIGTSGSGKSTFIKSLPQENLVVIEPDAMRVEFTGNINDKSKDKEIYIEAANRAIQAIKQGKQVVFDTTNLTKDKRLPFIEAVKKAIPDANIQYKLMELNPELAKQRIKAQIARGENRANVPDSTIDRHAESYKQMLEDIKNEPITPFVNKTDNTKTRRILEVQSDLFQKGRDKENLLSGDIVFFEEKEFNYNYYGKTFKLKSKNVNGSLKLDWKLKDNEPWFSLTKQDNPFNGEKEFEKFKDVIEKELQIKRISSKNQFLQLLNKDNNWVTFFIKSIIQDSAKKGYEKVLFPKGETAAKIEGHETIAEEIRKIDNRLDQLKDDESIVGNDNEYGEISVGELKKNLLERKQDLKSQGIEKLKPIEAFYEIRIGNILEKVYGKNNVKTITDEYGNQWREVSIKPEYEESFVFGLTGKGKKVGDKFNIFNINNNLNNTASILENIAKSNYPLSPLAKELIKRPLPQIPVRIGNDDEINSYKEDLNTTFSAVFDLFKNEIILDPKATWDRDIRALLMHEILHYYTLDYINLDGKYVKEFKSLYEYALNNTENKDLYGYKNMKEFISELFTNSKLIEDLMSIKPINNKKYNNLFQELWSNILKFFNITSDNSTLYNQAMALGSLMIDDAAQMKRDLINYNNDISNPELNFNIQNTPSKKSLEKIASSFNMLNTGYISKSVDINQLRKELNNNGFKHVEIKPTSSTGYYFAVNGRMINPYKKTIKSLNELDKQDLFGLTGNTKVTDFKDIFEKITDRYESQIKLLEKRLSVIRKQFGVNSPDAKKQIAALEKLIQDKKDKIESLEENKSYEALIKLAETQAKEIEAELIKYTKFSEKNLSEEALKYAMERLVELSLFINSWEDINELIPTKITDELHKDVQEIYGKYSGFKTVYLGLIKTYFTKITNKISYDTMKGVDLYKAIEDTSWLVMGTMSASHSTSDLVKVVKDIIDYARDKAHLEFIRKKKEIETIDKEMTKITGKEGIDKWEPFLQKDDKGNKTGNFVNPYKHEYFVIIEGLKKKLKNKEISIKEYYAERAKHEDWIGLNEYNKRIIGVFTEEDYVEQDRLLNNLKEDVANHEEELKGTGLYHNTDGSFKSEQLRIEYENKVSGYYHERNPFGFGSKGYLYRLDPKPKSKYKDPNYDKLFAPGNEKLLELYISMMSILKNNNDSLPTSALKGKSSTYIPEQLASKKIDISSIGQWIKSLIIEEISDDIDSRITIGSKTIKSVPITMMSNKLGADKKSYDIKRVLINHTAMAVNYKHLSNIAPVAEAAVDILDEMEEITIGKSGESVTSEKGITLKKKKRLSHTKQHLINTIDVLLYQERVKTEGKIYKTGMGKEAKQELADLDAKLAAEEITQEEYELQKKKIANEYITGSRITDSLIRYTYLKALSFPNIAAPAVNLFFGLMSNLTYAAGGVDFTTDEILKATTTMMQSVSKSIGGKLNEDAVNRIYGWMERLNVLGEVNESLYSHKRTFADKAVFLQVHAEKVNQGSVMIAMLKNQKVKTLSGEEIPLWDAYKIVDGDLVLDTDKMGEQDPIDIFRFKKKVEAVIHRIHGDYTSPMGFKRYALGRAMLLFRTWMPAAINERFGKETFNHDLGRATKGRYRSLLWAEDTDGNEVNFPQILKRLGKSLLFMNGMDGLSNLDKENLKRDLRELIIVASLSAVALMLKSMAAHLDDDEEAEWSLNYMSNILGKTTSDIIGFAWPGAMTQVLSNPITVMKTVKDLSEIYPAVSKTIQGDPTYKNGPWKGHNRIGKWVTYQVPGLYGAAKTVTSGEKIYEFF